MMWRRSIVQVGGAGAGSILALALALALSSLSGVCQCAELVIEIPADGAAADGTYRLDYRPERGSPAPNFTVPARASTINFQGLPGTKYHFMLYYSNATFADLLTWNQTIVTAPEPPTNLTVTLGRNKQATIGWAPPAHGDYTGFRFKVIPVAEGETRNVTVDAGGGGGGAGGQWTHTLRDLSPGATYQLHAFTLLHDKESAAYASRNFTTKPNTPGKFIVWFRNETTLLVLWQPPYPPGAYTHYKVSIVPPDARDSELYVEKEGEPPGPAQAAFKGLVPGRAYNISVQTVSEPEISAPTTAQYRTVPLRPADVAVDRVTETSFRVTWAPPHELSEFEKYQVSVSFAGGGGGGSGGGGGAGRRPAPVVLNREEPPTATFEGLEPGGHYSVTVKTMSGKVTSWPHAADVTLKPLPVTGVSWRRLEGEGSVELTWQPEPTLDHYSVSYHEAGSREDSNTLTVPNPRAVLDALLPGRNYSVSVCAVSRGVLSNETFTHVLTRPLAPVMRHVTSEPRQLKLAWSSDVNSRQDHYEVRWKRADVNQTEQRLVTSETQITLDGLFPGAVYELHVAAVSHGLRSDAHAVLKPTRPPPPASIAVERASSNSAVVRWSLPPPSEGAIGEVSLRYRTRGQWTKLPPLEPTHLEAEIVDMTPGEKYTIQLDTLSLSGGGGERVESGRPLEAERSVRPAPVSNVAALVDERNVTLEWPAGAGRVDTYRLVWTRQDPPSHEAHNLTVSPAPAPAPTRVTLPGLSPGAGYSIDITAHTHSLASDVFTMHTRTRPLIQSEMTIVTESDDVDDNSTLPAFLVIYTRTPASASEFDTYRFRLEPGEGGAGAGGAVERSLPALGAPQQLSFPGLEPGRLYNITMWTVSRNVSSHPVQRQARLFPRPISNLRAESITAYSVQLNWTAPSGVWTDFEVQWLTGVDRLEARATPHTGLAVANLRPYTNYTFSVETRAGGPAALLTRARARSATFMTLQAPPHALHDFQPMDSKPNEITFGWSLPEDEYNGQLKRIVIKYGVVDDHDEKEVELSGNARSATISGLSPGLEYRFAAWAESGAGAGAPAAWRQRMAIAAPPRPMPNALPNAVRRTTSTISVQFRSDYFSAANGNVTAYTLVVGEEPRNSSRSRLPSWRDVRALPVWPPYQVTEPYYPFSSSSVEEFTIGSERCEEALLRRYCNGPLKPGSKYYVKLRAFTAPDKYTDTAYAVFYTEVDNTAWIVGGSVVAGALAAAGAAALVLRRRRAPAPAPHPAHAPPASRPVRVADFLDHYRLMSADSDFRFSEEFEELKSVGREQPCSAADLPCNRPKNRFTNILPYDHSRFKLQPVDDEEGSDYINANYVPGYTSPREFLVTQGPLHSTRDDFWRMCWESGTRAIVMLTRCVEKGREKCDRYWPYDTRPALYGDIAVTALNETRLPDWTVTELLVARGQEQRVLVHLHFTTWPDFGVPSPPTTLVRFVRAFRERVPPAPAPRPTVVHCSAGVGRSGTFITLDSALQHLANRAESLDIFGMVAALRRERVWMVQTEQQYICVHQCVAAVLEGQELPPPQHHHHNQAYDDDEGIAESGM